MKFDTLAIHAGRSVDPASGAVTTPIHPSTTYERDPDGGFSRGYDYARSNNPTRESFEHCLAALEGGAGSVAFASGMAATTAVIEAVALAPQARPVVVMPADMYFGNLGLVRNTDFASRLQFHGVDMTDLDTLDTLCRDERPSLVWAETPSNPRLTVTDLRAIAEIAHRWGARMVVDNTWASPALQRPLSFGADGVMHAVTKYIGGHSDMMAGGVVWGQDDGMLARLRAQQSYKGAVPSPFDCWLALRGVQSLKVRMEAHWRSAQVLAERLDAHRAVVRVHYPGLPSDPGHGIAARQMDGFGGMLSFVVRGGREAAFTVANSLSLIIRATSLGGAHSLIEHRASIEGEDSRAPQGLLRLSVGLEDVEDLWADLEAALDEA
ncbi:MAG: trans-sulfuration enzyme family protein [Alphaproteobacteria bacterium]